MEEIQAKTVILPRIHDLPQHIIDQILARLPLKSLSRFKSVCRQWYDVISSSPDFPEVRFQQSISKLRIVCRMKHPENSYYSFRLEDGGIKARKASTLCLEDATSTRLLSCNSLILFRGGRNGTDLNVLDTSTQQKILLPKIGRYIDDYSFVYDASKRNYKVVGFVRDYYRGGISVLLYNFNPGKWWRSGNWRESKPPIAQVIPQHSSVVVQGVLYWIAEPANPNGPLGYYQFIQPMYIATEKFMERIKPPCQIRHVPAIYHLLEMKASLCLVHGASVDVLNIWVLKDSQQSYWIKQYTTSLSSVVNRPSGFNDFVDPFSFHPRLIVENKILATIGSELYWYNMDNKELSKITLEFASYSSYGCIFSRDIAKISYGFQVRLDQWRGGLMRFWR